MTDNELVAEFMLNQEQFKLTSCIGIANGLYQIGDPSDKIPYYQNVYLRYNTSWDWLMPVCIRIDAVLADNIEKRGYNDECLVSNDMEARYYAVIEFIKWYNEVVVV